MIRTLTGHDREQAVALWEATGLTRPWNDPRADFQRAIDSPASAVLGWCEDEAVLGTAMVGDDGHRGWVYYVAVAPSRQGQGLGRVLMEACEEWLRQRGAPKIQFMVRRSNEAVVAIYARLGYEAQDCLVLGRRLDA